MQITTITFFRFDSFKTKIWAFSNMRKAGELAGTDGLLFHKLMGSGRGLGFNAWPDWSIYVLLQVWEDERQAIDFFENNPFFREYRKKTAERWTVFLHNIRAHGQWDGQNPFVSQPELHTADKPLMVLTRATIKWKRMIPFWSYVSTSQKPLKTNEGLIYTKGIGEVPVRQMATVSFWKNKQALNDFAYKSQAHKGAIERTKRLDWYSEEMFARFAPYKSVGSWQGRDMLSEWI